MLLVSTSATPRGRRPYACREIYSLEPRRSYAFPRSYLGTVAELNKQGNSGVGSRTRQ